MKAILLSALLALPLCAQQPAPLTPQAILEHTRPATVVILAGSGAGRLSSIATGVIISKDGTILTAAHAIKGANEVQVRLANGETFDRVTLLGMDERRDVAALKIAGGGLAALAPGTTTGMQNGDPVYAVTNAGGLTWSATEGILSAMRPAEEVPGAGSGFRLLQFTAPVAPGASGGALVDRAGALIGIITSGMSPNGRGNAAFAVPIDGVVGLPESGMHIALGSGAALEMPVEAAAQTPKSSAAIANASPQEILKTAKTMYIFSKTSFLTVDTLDRALLLEKVWPKLELTIVNDKGPADLILEIDRPLFTYVHTFVLSDKKTTIVLGSGKVTAFDGTIASSGLADQIVKIFAGARLPPTVKK